MAHEKRNKMTRLGRKYTYPLILYAYGAVSDLFSQFFKIILDITVTAESRDNVYIRSKGREDSSQEMDQGDARTRRTGMKRC